MSLTEIFKIAKGTKVILLITFFVSLLVILFAFFYYRHLNSSNDPRITEARRLLALFDRKSSGLSISDAFQLLDSANRIFLKFDDYSESFERGLIYNNKCTYLLMSALYDSSVSSTDRINLLNIAGNFCDTSAMIYKRWIYEWGALSEKQIFEKIKPEMQEDDTAFTGYNYQKILKQRIRYIVDAQLETPRRLSVSFTNKATIYRHLRMSDSAFLYLEKALQLWPENRIASSNLSILYGGEPLKPSIIESLFPPDKNKKD